MMRRGETFPLLIPQHVLRIIRKQVCYRLGG